MPKKTQVMERLSALKPAVPTNTRQHTEPAIIEDTKVAEEPAKEQMVSTVIAAKPDMTVSVPISTDSYVMTEVRPGYINLVAQNMNAMLKIREILLNEIGKINVVIIDTWKQSMIVSFDIFRTNAENIADIVRGVFVDSSQEKK
ncbi:MAG: hypothetical protein HQK88_09590 [Nitrospirae bacterium]|nr:hypothetical protein [Nitrospirota bacterium]MBF0534163.1 hypothetical protein [Nitrospirota bacterium]MBF0617050.1 hypothetical protein [Nitrospirota bacterium]